MVLRLAADTGSTSIIWMRYQSHKLPKGGNMLNQAMNFSLAVYLLILGINVNAQITGNTVPEKILHYADTIVINGKIVTMDNKEILSDDPGSIFQAMALRDGKILDLGSNEYIRTLAGPSTRIMDVKGKTVIPGLIETHVHPESTLSSTPSVQEQRDAYELAPGLHSAFIVEDNPADTLDLISEMLREFPPEPGEWVHINLLTDGTKRYPEMSSVTDGIYNHNIFTLEDVTRLLPNNPAVLQNGRGTAAVAQPGLVVRVRIGPNRQAQTEALKVPDDLANLRNYPIRDTDNPFIKLFVENIAKARASDFHAHVEMGCPWAEEYPAHHAQPCSHNVSVLNQMALDKTLAVWPAFTQSANDMTYVAERGGDRGFVGGVLNDSGAWVSTLFPSRVPDEMYMEWLRQVMLNYAEGGLTMIASSIEEGRTLTAFYRLLREDHRLPIRFGYGYEMLRTPLLYPAHPQLPVQLGSHWGPPEANEWFWPMGITDGGSGDSRWLACFGDDLPGPPEVKEMEQCMEGENYRISQTLMPALRSGWRIFSIHSFGSDQFRKHRDWIEQVRQEAGYSMDYIRGLRLSFAHGGAVGKIPDVIQTMLDYNMYVPIRPSDVAESLIQVRRYGPEGLEFLAPVKTLLEAGVKVVGEGGHELNPEIYFRDLSMFSTRVIKDPSDPRAVGEIIMPEEAVNRVTALRLYTSRAAEWLFAENLAGSLEPGKFADFVVIDRDYFTVPLNEIEDNKFLMTVVGDQIMYQDTEWQPVFLQ